MSVCPLSHPGDTHPQFLTLKSGFSIRNRVKIPLLMLDDAPPDYTRQETKVARARGRLKYAAANDQAPQVECEVRVRLIPWLERVEVAIEADH